MQNNIKINIDNILPFIKKDEIDRIADKILDIDTCMSNDTKEKYLGWLNLPSKTPASLIREINSSASYIKENADMFICIGIGGSYLGAKAGIEFSNHTFHNHLDNGLPDIYFAGHNISSDYLADLLDLAVDKDVCVNVISKSGTTIEPAVAFRVIKDFMEKKYGKDGAKNRIIATTDKKGGALRTIADREGYKSFIIPDDVGGRFSVFTPVGLLPMAAAGIDIARLMQGGANGEASCGHEDIYSNPAYLYAGVRHILYKSGKSIEILSAFHPSLHYLSEWWKQLAGESEGKDGKGIYPASMDFTTDLHSMGQWVQDGRRIIFETFMTIESSNRSLKVSRTEDDADKLNYLEGVSLDSINDKAYLGTREAHKEGGVPNMTISLKDRKEETLGEALYFFEKGIAISGYLTGVNPFDQPGVEFYKKNMFSLLGK